MHVVAADSVVDTGKISYIFMINSDMPRDFGNSKLYGNLYLREKAPNEVNPFRLARGEPGAIGPDGFKRWTCHLGDSYGQKFFASADEDKINEEGLQQILKDLPDGILLVEKNLLERIQAACTFMGIELHVHSYDGTLATS